MRLIAVAVSRLLAGGEPAAIARRLLEQPS
jgi:hypothetical protein